MPSSVSPRLQPASRRTRFALRTGAVTLGVAVASLVIPASTGEASSLSHDFYKLRQCESSGRWSANTGNGYYGAYQFAESTWRGLGYHGRPDQAKPGVQTDAATKLHARDGWHPWPACARKEHLH